MVHFDTYSYKLENKRLTFWVLHLGPAGCPGRCRGHGSCSGSTAESRGLAKVMLAFSLLTAVPTSSHQGPLPESRVSSHSSFGPVPWPPEHSAPTLQNEAWYLGCAPGEAGSLHPASNSRCSKPTRREGHSAPSLPCPLQKCGDHPPLPGPTVTYRGHSPALHD